MNALRDKMSSYKSTRYHALETDGFLTKEKADSSSEDGSDMAEWQSQVMMSRSHRRRSMWTTGGLIFFMMTTIIAAFAYMLKKPTDRECGIQTTVWSPANEAVEYETFNFDNAFAHDTIYRGPPTPQLERAWEDLWYYDGVRVPEDKLPLLDRSFDLGNNKTLRAVEGDEGGVHALIEVFHQLHCLNLIRQFTWKDWYLRHTDIVRTPADLLDSEVGSRMHVDHCIEALRITLMCHGDTTPYLIMVDPSAATGLQADFSPYHKCRKFDRLQDWARENEMSRPPTHHWEPESTL